MMKYINKLRRRTFPTILTESDAADGGVFLLMEELQKHVTFLRKVYVERTTHRELANILSHVFDAIRLMHTVTPKSCVGLNCLPQTKDPFYTRLREKLLALLEIDPDCANILSHPGTVNGHPCPSIKQLFAKIAAVVDSIPKSVSLRLVHGDPHFGNIMVRKNGKYGYRVRLIDPNPEIGFSQPLYDLGKLLHWAEPVGWAQIKPSLCRARWSGSAKGSNWTLNSWVGDVSASAEKRRSFAKMEILRFAEEYRAIYGNSFNAVLILASASAHLGLAALLRSRNEQPARRFVLAFALQELSKIDLNN
jgi:uncharacterized protein YeaO (DUF488 family)